MMISIMQNFKVNICRNCFIAIVLLKLFGRTDNFGIIRYEKIQKITFMLRFK